MDVVSNILGLLDLRASVFFHSRFCGSWALDGASEHRATFHLVARGNCWLHLADQGRSIALTGGDLVVLPRPVAHTLGDEQQAPETVDKSPPPSATEDEATTSLVCGYFDFGSPQANPLLEAMPDVVHIRNEDPARPADMAALLQAIAAETESDAPGSDAIVDRLSEILFVHVVRAFMRQRDAQVGLLAALADVRLGPVLGAIHDGPGDAWSVDRLAGVAGMSRSAFAKHFQSVVGLTPMQYVTRWRMQAAYEQLRTTRDSVGQVAEAAGYATEASFRKAFKQQTGVGPGAVRKLSNG